MKLYVCILLLCNLLELEAAGTVFLKGVQMCDKQNYSFGLTTAKQRVQNKRQEFDWLFDVYSDFDNNNKYQIEVSRDFGNGKLKRLLSFGKPGACNGLYELGGEVAMDVMTHLKIPNAGTCPIKKGKYHMEWRYVDLALLPVAKLIPKGGFLLNFKVFDVAGKNVLTCLNIGAQKS